jgi:hypothetical protein
MKLRPRMQIDVFTNQRISHRELATSGIESTAVQERKWMLATAGIESGALPIAKRLLLG